MEHRYSYDCVIEKDYDDGVYLVHFPQIPGAYSYGDTREEAMRNAQDVLRLCLADCARGEERAPEYERSAEVVNVSVVITPEDVEEMSCLTLSQVADELEVSPSRVTALVKSGSLDVRVVKGRRMVTIESVERYRAGGRRPGRPRKDGAQAVA